MRRKSVYNLAILVFVMSFALSVSSQEEAKSENNEEKPKLVSWYELKVDITTPEDIIRMYGKPKKDKKRKKLREVYPIYKWLYEEKDKKIFRALYYNRIPYTGKSAKFYFLENKLVCIYIIPPNFLRNERRWIWADELEDLFGFQFKPIRRSINSPEEFNHIPSDFKKYKYYYWKYAMIAVEKKVFVFAGIHSIRNPFKSIEKYREETGRKYPGFVEEIAIVSRRLEAEKWKRESQ